MNRRMTLTTAAVAVATAATITGFALNDSVAATPSHHEHFRIYSGNVNDHDLTEIFAGHGPVHGVGVAVPDDDAPDNAIPVVVTMPNGDTLDFTAHGAFNWVPNLAACTATEHDTGTFTVTGGTGRYRHAHGSGTYVENGVGIGNRDSEGNCEQSFKINYVVVDASGSIRL